jgi:EAL domain-containing protein (putative c-di-GMP-specific phosphodiesterase class I)
VSLAIDDFGSGLSSFACLRRLPVHTIKIDGSFIAGVGQNRDDEIIIKAIIDLSHALGKRVVAERVETRAQLAFLQAHGCDEAQGFLFGPPMPERAVRIWRAATAPAAAPESDHAAFRSARAETRLAVGP